MCWEFSKSKVLRGQTQTRDYMLVMGLCLQTLWKDVKVAQLLTVSNQRLGKEQQIGPGILVSHKLRQEGSNCQTDGKMCLITECLCGRSLDLTLTTHFTNRTISGLWQENLRCTPGSSMEAIHFIKNNSKLQQRLCCRLVSSFLSQNHPAKVLMSQRLGDLFKVTQPGTGRAWRSLLNRQSVQSYWNPLCTGCTGRRQGPWEVLQLSPNLHRALDTVGCHTDQNTYKNGVKEAKVPLSLRLKKIKLALWHGT